MKTEEREQARELRKQGCSIREIAKRLHIAKSSVSLWTRDIELTEEQKQVLSLNKAVNYKYILGQSRRNIELSKARHNGYMIEGQKKCEKDIGFRILCALYWGEGRKNKNTFGITNCSTDMLRIVGEWLIKEGFHSKIRFYIQYHIENMKKEKEISFYWTSKLRWLKSEHFTNMSQIKINRASQRKRIGKQPFGTATVYVHDTRLANMVKGGIEYIKQMGL